MITTENIRTVIKELIRCPYQYYVNIAELTNGDIVIEFTAEKGIGFQIIYNGQINVTYFYGGIAFGTIRLSVDVTEDIEEDINKLIEVCDNITENNLNQFIETNCKS